MRQIIRFIGLVLMMSSCYPEADSQQNNITYDTTDFMTIVKEIIHDTIFVEKDNRLDTAFFVHERLPDWFIETEMITYNNLVFKQKYKYDFRMNPLYLEEDFNGDDTLDLAIPIIEIETEKTGFAIIHGGTLELIILGAGIPLAEDFTDNVHSDIWRINRNKEHEAGLDTTPPILKTQFPVIEILMSDIGGGIIYWNGNEYAYFHQTC